MRWTDDARRRRVVVRHRLGRTAVDVDDAVGSTAVFHSTDPTTPYLAAWARAPGFSIVDLDDALVERRSLWRMHTIRRTLFLVPSQDVPAFEAGAARDVARRERNRLVGWLNAEMDPATVPRWLEDVGERVVAALDGRELATRALAAEVPELSTALTIGSGKWATRSPVSSRLLFLLAMDGLIVRTRPAGSWRSSAYRWTTVPTWLGGPLPRLEEPEGRAIIAERYLASYGPVTTTDLRWWTGWTAKHARDALAEIGAATVELDSGEHGWVLRGDTDVEELPDGPVVTLLPALDATPMGWKQRDWYLGPHAASLFDTAGNVGPTVWLDGRIVGGWGQRSDGEVAFELLEPVDGAVLDRIEHEAAALTTWLDGDVAIPRFPTPLGRRLSG